MGNKRLENKGQRKREKQKRNQTETLLSLLTIIPQAHTVAYDALIHNRPRPGAGVRRTTETFAKASFRKQCTTVFK